MEDTSTRSEPESPSEESADPPDDPEAPDTEPAEDGSRATDGTPEAEPASTDADGAPGDEDDIEALRERVESEYDFDDFGPSDMAQMSAEEWDAAFDPDTWITGDRLLDRVDAELKSRIATRDVFGVLERVREDGEERILVYSDEGYAIIRPTGEVRGEGTVLRDIEPVVALAAMDSYEVPEPPEDWSLPHPDSVPEGSGEFGNLVIQAVAGIQVLAGVALLVATAATDLDTIVAPAMGIVFLLVGVFLFAMVANARLSDRFRSEEYRDRLRALREAKERPEFVPVEDGVVTGEDGATTDPDRDE
ncbi:hypothetical protein PM076_01865 [Halorubrum ezzemoulense]|jgi:hypothetical protein|uniref:DUF7319 domain-containing protein n=1 Tax=Halorubrum ezzemoulense TaxID=337243 RepID=A0A256J7Z5_HALEZ|nr:MULTISPECIES: hypothetical protein [Halorubrum]MDB2223696.1 hypothetical protein [Halorubrum ezzemoulense]MDB2236519.1 hypothetical protein [Halorubrum ezzemoulense]MDB2241124.1 hypothetical protein [Halorubrum ezzemoulense]MDB2244823.1 hypothetical protein [Halorubrum ezzemoulense]MDB2248193.1 hypothetical protein [Halorubrum ezzemoulense]